MKESVKINYPNGYYIGEAQFVYEKDGIQYYSREGEGEMFYDNGMYQAGTWKKDKLDGIGTVVFKNGDIYKGEFKSGYKHGQGYYKFYESGKVYKVTMRLNKVVEQELDHIDNNTSIKTTKIVNDGPTL